MRLYFSSYLRTDIDKKNQLKKNIWIERGEWKKGRNEGREEGRKGGRKKGREERGRKKEGRREERRKEGRRKEGRKGRRIERKKSGKDGGEERDKDWEYGNEHILYFEKK